jgi:thioredoxin domain-containing protein 5
LEQWLFENRLPTTVELTEDTFQDVMRASHRPLVVIVAATKDSRDKISDKLKDIGKVWRVRQGLGKTASRDVVFTWMDMDRWGSFMKSMYGISSNPGPEPSVVIADHGV